MSRFVAGDKIKILDVNCGGRCYYKIWNDIVDELIIRGGYSIHEYLRFHLFSSDIIFDYIYLSNKYEASITYIPVGPHVAAPIREKLAGLSYW